LKKQIATLIALCHRYGTSRYVSGGGGNVSWKNNQTLWIKASGTYLSQADLSTLVTVRREPLGDLYRTPAPEDISEREDWANRIVQSAVTGDGSGARPSVETPLHDLFSADYVVHTHPPLVNGLACAKNAESACEELFPEALCVPYVDPGVTLCMQVKRQFEDYIRDHGCEPSVMVMQNHGLVVAADSLAEIDRIHEQVFRVLEEAYWNAGLDTASPDFGMEEASALLPSELVIQDGTDPVVLKCTGIHPAPGPLTPDHVVYSGVEPFMRLNGNTLDTYRERFGSDPSLLIHDGTLYARGATHSRAKAACDLAADGALVFRLTDAFGGANFMHENQWRFVVNWEAESYRQSVA
jgi:rhamnose utilization protein RhaD (predicted bifunctional aldolase and dehydrogenase)